MKHKHLAFLLAMLMSMVASVASADTREYVDLGLPSGTLWATCNVGADSPEDYGLYFAWGETTGYTGDTSDGPFFDWTSYIYNYGAETIAGNGLALNKYCSNSNYGYELPECFDGYNGFTDDLTELVPEDDAATANWGANWRMPSEDQFSELINSEYTTTEWTTVNGVYGRKITSKVSGHVGNFIFLPAAGYRGNSLLNSAGSYGYYWSRTLNTSNPSNARRLYFDSSDINTSNGERCYGLSVRPVCVPLTLSPSSLSLVAGGSTQLAATVTPTAASDTSLTWSSSDTEVAVVGSDGVVVAVAPGTCTISITCELKDGNNVSVTCKVTVIPAEYVDLGLPSGTLWATCNVGANSPEDYGRYFAWGETTTKSTYDWSTYKYAVNNYDYNEYGVNEYHYPTKYCNNSSYGKNGFTDNLTELLPEDDAATAIWGSEWCMPSEAQFCELINSSYTTTEWTTLNGVYGRKITSKMSGHVGNFVFLPAAGYRENSSLYSAGSFGDYWSRTLSTRNPVYARYLDFVSSDIGTSSYHDRCSGLSVRPVRVSPVATSIALSPSSLSLVAGVTTQFTATVILAAAAATTALTWSSSDTEVAVVGSDGVVVAVAPGTCTITCETTDGSNVSATCEVTVIPATEKEYVDLGLPSGTLWATCNVGAINPEDNGLYFAWGETTGYTGDTSDGRNFFWPSYEYCNGSSSTLTKYCNNSSYGNNGFTDDLTELVPEDDAATANWGSEWCMPSEAQFCELINSSYTTTEWTTLNGVYGRKITSKVAGYVGNFIFLPAAGCRYTSWLCDAGSGGYYWSRTLNTSYPYGARDLYFNSGFIYTGGDDRYYGQSVRPVRVSPVATGIALSPSSLSLEAGGSTQLTATVTPAAAAATALTWSSSDTEVAVVGSDGVVVAVAPGTCTITCETTDGSNVSATCEVTVISVATGIALSSSSLSLTTGSYAQLTAIVSPAAAAATALTWSSSDTDVAVVGSNGMVVAVAAGTCTITCETTDGSNVSATCEVTVIPAGEKEYVDLGLPSGTLWATCNIGADNPEDYGLYFAWGETTGYTQDTSDGSKFNWASYKYCNGSETTLTKYCINSSYGYNGFTDNLTELVSGDDAATANWGSEWCMPSVEQFDELINKDYTTTEWTTVNGVYGRKITSKMSGYVGNYIFLPAAGYRSGSSLRDAGSAGRYWSNTNTGYTNTARRLYFYSSAISAVGNNRRSYGLSVRPVRVSPTATGIDPDAGVDFGGAVTAIEADTWYYLYQGRNSGQNAGTYPYLAAGEIPESGQGGLMADCGEGNDLLKKDVTPLLNQVSIETAAPYLVRFVKEEGTEDAYKIQFGTGNWLTAPNGTGNNKKFTTSSTINDAGTFNVYAIEEGTAYFALNVSDERGDYQELIDNNGTGNTIVTWDSGQKTTVSGNSVWSIHEVIITALDEKKIIGNELAALADEISTAISSFKGGTQPGCYDSELLGNLSSLLEEINMVTPDGPDYDATTIEQLQAYIGQLNQAYQAVLASKVPFTLTTGYYRIKSAMTFTQEVNVIDEGTGEETTETKIFPKYMMSQKNGETINGVWGTPEDLNVAAPALWYITSKDDGTFDVLNVNAQARFNNVANSTAVTLSKDSENLMAIDPVATDADGITYVDIRVSTQAANDYYYLHAGGHGNGSGVSGNLVGWCNTYRGDDGQAEEQPRGSEWTFEPISEAKALEIIEAYQAIKNRELMLEQYDNLLAVAKEDLAEALDFQHVSLINSVDQLSSPYTEPSEGSLAALLDGDTSTFWHSNWSDGSVDGGIHYLQVDLINPVDHDIYVTFTRRAVNHAQVTNMSILGTNDPEAEKAACTELLTFDCPFTSNTETITSELFDTQNFRYLRLYANTMSPSTRGYWHMSELQLCYYAENPDAPFYYMGEVGKNLQQVIEAQAELEREDITIDDYNALKAAHDAFLDKLSWMDYPIVNLQDGNAYDFDTDTDLKRVTYTRNFTNTEWQALYIPFEMQYEDWKDDFELARINNMHQYDDDEDGNVDRTILEVFKVKSGHTEAHTPYLIKAMTTGEKTIMVNCTTLYAAEERSYDVSSWNTLYTFTGTYTGVPGETMFSEGYYALGNGRLHQSDDATYALKPMRWYVAVTDRYGNPKNLGEVKVVVFGMDETDGIEDVKWQMSNGKCEMSDGDGAVYDLNGRRVTNPRKGLYIKNGKKFVIK